MMGQALPEALQVVQMALPIVWCCDRMHLEAARIERPAEPAHHAALAGGIPALQYDDGVMRGAEIGLLHELQRVLHGGKSAFIVGELDRREMLHRGEMGATENSEVSGLHNVVHHGCVP